MCRGISPLGTISGLSWSFSTCRETGVTADYRITQTSAVQTHTWKSTHLHLSGTMKKGSIGHFGRPACSLHRQKQVDKFRSLSHTHTHVRVTLARQGVPLQPRLYCNVGFIGPAAAALDGNACGLCTHPRSLNHNSRHLHQPSHVL